MQVVINPGSESVDHATLDDATANIKRFITDLEIDDPVRVVRLPEEDERGRFGFLLWWENCCTTIQMPGLPLDRVRYVNRAQNPWEYPRLYVDGSSWLWCFALSAARAALTGIDEED